MYFVENNFEVTETDESCSYVKYDNFIFDRNKVYLLVDAHSHIEKLKIKKTNSLIACKKHKATSKDIFSTPHFILYICIYFLKVECY